MGFRVITVCYDVTGVERLVLTMVQEWYFNGFMDLRILYSLIELATYMVACTCICLLLHTRSVRGR